MDTWQFPPITPFYILATIAAWFVAYRAWQMRPARGSTPLSLMAFSSGIWAITNAAGVMTTGLTLRLIILQITYVGVIGTLYFWAVFAIAYSQYDQWLTRKTLIRLAIIPLGVVLMVLTLHWHDLFYTATEMVKTGNYYVFSSHYGPVFWVWAAYGYTLAIGGAILLINSVVRFPTLYRGQATLIITAVMLPTSLNLAYITGFDPLNIGTYDPSPLAYSISAALILVAMYRFHFLHVVPVAHDLVFKAVKGAVIVIDNNAVIMDLNPTAETAIGRSAEELIGQNMLAAFPEYQKLILNFRHVHEVKTEISISGRMFELQLMPLTDRSGKPSGRIIMLYDITDLRRALDELDAYAHTVAHDLKNPLGGILSYTNYIRDELLTEQLDLDEISYSLDAIASSGNKMRAIIENLLTLASVRNQAVVEMKPLDMAEIVDNALSRLTRLIDETKVQIQQPEQWLVAVGHAPWVEEIWANYISNAIKYGGSPPILTLGADLTEDDHVRFWVQDNGRGLTATEQQQLFTKFSRLDRHREIEGHGLGLSIVRRIAHKLGGEVGVESTPGQGSRFYFTLPLPAAPAETPAATSVTSFPAL